MTLTADDPEWRPGTKRFSDHEEAMSIQILLIDDPIYDATVVSVMSNAVTRVVPLKRYGKCVTKLCRTVKVVKTGSRQNHVGAALLAQRWGITLSRAEDTIGATTQHVVRTTLHPTLFRRFRTIDRQLRYRHLPYQVFTDTMQSSLVSWYRQNKYAQVFCTCFGWSRVYPMRRKADAHEGLSLMAQRDGVPIAIIMDGSKTHTISKFRTKCKEMGCHVKQTEPHSPWQNAAEGAICELKKDAVL